MWECEINGAVEAKRSKLWIVLKGGNKKDGKGQSAIIYYTTKAWETPKDVYAWVKTRS